MRLMGIGFDVVCAMLATCGRVPCHGLGVGDLRYTPQCTPFAPCFMFRSDFRCTHIPHSQHVVGLREKGSFNVFLDRQSDFMMEHP
jgi:hypothetical protein